jgi:hypothetical protein
MLANSSDGPFLVLSYSSNMKLTEKPRSGKKEQVQPKPSRSVQRAKSLKST